METHDTTPLLNESLVKEVENIFSDRLLKTPGKNVILRSYDTDGVGIPKSGILTSHGDVKGDGRGDVKEQVPEDITDVCHSLIAVGRGGLGRRGSVKRDFRSELGT